MFLRRTPMSLSPREHHTGSWGEGQADDLASGAPPVFLKPRERGGIPDKEAGTLPPETGFIVQSARLTTYRSLHRETHISRVDRQVVSKTNL